MTITNKWDPSCNLSILSDKRLVTNKCILKISNHAHGKVNQIPHDFESSLAPSKTWNE